MPEIGNLTDIILMVGGLIVTYFGVVKSIFKKVIKSFDELEDVIIVGGKIATDSAEVLTAIVEAGKPDENGAITFTSVEWEKIKGEVKDVKAGAAQFSIELKEAVAAGKAIFQKEKNV